MYIWYEYLRFVRVGVYAVKALAHVSIITP